MRHAPRKKKLTLKLHGLQRHLPKRRALSRGDRQRHLLQPATRVLPRVEASCAGVDLRPDDPEAEAADVKPSALGDPLDKNTDIGAIKLEAPTDPGARPKRRGGICLPAECHCAEGLVVRATGVHQRGTELPPSARRRFGAGFCVLTFRGARRSGREGEQHAPMSRPGSGAKSCILFDARPSGCTASMGLGDIQPLGPDLSRSAAQECQGWSRGRACTASRGLREVRLTRLPVANVQALHRGRISHARNPAARGRTLRSGQGRTSDAVRGGLPEMGGDDRLNRGQILLIARHDGGSPGSVRGVGSAIRQRSTLPSTRYAGWADSRSPLRVLGHRIPWPGPYFNLTIQSRQGWLESSTGRAAPPRARQARSSALRRGKRSRETASRRDHPRRVLARDIVPGGTVNVLSGARERALPGTSRPHGCSAGISPENDGARAPRLPTT